MTKLLKLYIFFFVILLVNGCSSFPFKPTSTSIKRSIADSATENSCEEIVSNILHHNKQINPASEIPKAMAPPGLIEPTFTKILKMRATLKEKYEKVLESIRDFNPTLDRAIEGSAKLLVDPQEAYLAKIMMMRRAKYSIDISYYIFHDDESSRALLHEIRLAIKRGVKVRLMVDSLGSLTNAPLYSELKALTALRGGAIRDLNGHFTAERAKAEAVIINPLFNIRGHVINWYKKIQNLFLDEGNKLPLTTFSMNRRSHDKILMIDSYSPQDSMAIVGGRNVANYYYAVGNTKNSTFQDLEILVKNITKKEDGESTQNALENYYNKIFFYMANKNLEDFLIKINRDGVQKSLIKMREGYKALFSEGGMNLTKKLEDMEKNNFLDNNFEEGMLSIVNELQNFSRTKALLTPLAKQNKINGNSLVGKLGEEMRTARKSINIVSPYLWLSDEDIIFLKKWLAEDSKRELKVISNSISTTDNIAAQAMVDTILGPKLVTELQGSPIANQVKVYAYGKSDALALGGTTEYGKLHAKFAIIDDKKVLVGTSNLDPRSRYLNTELGIFFEGKDNVVATDLKKYFEKLADMSYEWGSDDWKALRENEKLRISLGLQYFVGKIIHYFKLVPLI